MPATELERPCNLDDYVTPNHFSVEQFASFKGLSVDEEFDLVAPVVIFLEADSQYRAKARVALKKLKALGHPLLDEVNVASVINTGSGMDAARGRYNALMMVLVDSVIPGIDSYIDAHGGFSFRVPDDSTLLSGDASGLFAFYESAQAVRERLADAA